MKTKTYLLFLSSLTVHEENNGGIKSLKQLFPLKARSPPAPSSKQLPLPSDLQHWVEWSTIRNHPPCLTPPTSGGGFFFFFHLGCCSPPLPSKVERFMIWWTNHSLVRVETNGSSRKSAPGLRPPPTYFRHLLSFLVTVMYMYCTSTRVTQKKCAISLIVFFLGGGGELRTKLFHFFIFIFYKPAWQGTKYFIYLADEKKKGEPHVSNETRDQDTNSWTTFYYHACKFHTKNFQGEERIVLEKWNIWEWREKKEEKKQAMRSEGSARHKY